MSDTLLDEYVAKDYEQVAITPYRALWHWYDINGYEGQAYTLCEKDGGLYWNEGGHCSCYGLEGQWRPAPIHVDVVRQYIKGRRWDVPADECVELETILAQWEEK